jgi:tRNA 2-thiouridine synthesizing protein A
MADPAEILVDARGHRCPVPTLKLRRALETGPAGAVIRLIADDPMARIDVPHFAAQTALDITSFEERDGVIDIRLRRSAPEGSGT